MTPYVYDASNTLGNNNDGVIREPISWPLDSTRVAGVGNSLYWDLIGRVNELETRLLDSKISDRVRGFLMDGVKSELVSAIARHEEGVLRPIETSRILETIVHELETEVEERRITTLAKDILQGATAMSEEEARAHLRALSRRSRKPLKEVALKLIEGRFIQRSTA